MFKPQAFTVPMRVPSSCAMTTGFLFALFSFLLQIISTYVPWFVINDVVYNGFLTSFSFSPTTLCPSSLHPYIPDSCMAWVASSPRLKRFGDCCNTSGTYLCVLALMLTAFLLCLLCLIALSLAIWKRDDPRHLPVVKAVGMALTLCGLCGLLSIAVFFLTGAITPSNWTYVAQLPGSSSSVSAGPFMTAITSVSFFTAGLPLCLWSACSHRPCGSRCSEIRQPKEEDLSDDDYDYDDEYPGTAATPHNSRPGTTASPQKASVHPAEDAAELDYT